MGRFAGCVLLLLTACTRENPWFSVQSDDGAPADASSTTEPDATSAVTSGEPMSSGPAMTSGAIDPDTSGDPAETSSSSSSPSAPAMTTTTADVSTSSESGEPGSSSSIGGESTDTGESTGDGLCTVCGTPGCGDCPVVPQVEFDGKFSIDAYEVTNIKYMEFLAVPISPEIQHPACSWKTDFTPGGPWPPSMEQGKFPVVSIDWCDAEAYCKWAGKRLCGAIGGGPGGYDFDSGIADKNTNQWYRACSGTGGNLFPYGNMHEPGRCNDVWAMKGGRVEVGSLPDCWGSAQGLFDMNGNVFELVDACEGDGDDALCLRRGGSFKTDLAKDERCDLMSPRPRSARFDYVGTRCCTDLP